MKKVKNIKTIAIVGLWVICIAGLTVNYLHNQPKRELEKQVRALTGRNIDLSFELAKAYFNGVDSTYISLPIKKLVVFVDSTSCSGCFISHLTDYYEVNDTLQSKQAELLVVLHPQKRHLKDVIHRLSHERLPFWCIVDEDGEFIQNNTELPSNHLLHSFAIDENDNIILIGNPTRNLRLRDMIYNLL